MLKQLEENIEKTLEDLGILTSFSKNSSCFWDKSKNYQKGLHPIKKLLHSKGKNDQNGETTYRMGGKSLPAIHLRRD
jgi:hypothetical protein